MAKIYKGAVGTRITLDAGTSLADSGSPTYKIKYIKPDGTEGEWTATLDTGNNNRIYYDTQANDLDQAGMWSFQLYAEITGWTGHGELVKYRVYDPIEVT